MKPRIEKILRFMEETAYNYFTLIVMVIAIDVLAKIPLVGFPVLGIALIITAAEM